MLKLKNIGKMAVVVILFLLAGGNVSGQQEINWNNLDTNKVVAGELLVKFKKLGHSQINTMAAVRGAAHAQVNATLLHRYRFIDWDYVKIPAGMSLADAAAMYKSNPDVVAVEPNYRIQPLAIPNDPRYGELWGMPRIKAPQVWDISKGSTNIVVAVIDTGIRFTHEDLAANIWNNPGETGVDGSGNDKRTNGIDDDGNGYVDDWHGWDFIDNDNDPTDEIPVGEHGRGHGSHCAGTIGGVGNNGKGVAGVNWHVKIVPLRFLGVGGGTTADGIKAIEYATMMHQYIKLTSNSWGGGPYEQALKDAIDASGAAGQLFVAAAGNDSSDNDAIPSYPASYTSANIISVASINNTGSLSWFSNYGRTSVDIAAPGSDILSCGIDSDSDYVLMSGTSMACPHVAGAAALLWSIYPTAAWSEIKDMILNHAAYNSALVGKVATDGELDIYAGLIAVTPSGDYFASGEPNIGPYLPSNITYKISNYDSTPVTWNVMVHEAWLHAPGTVIVPATGSVDVVISVDQAVAAGLSIGVYSDTIVFSNLTSGVGSTTRYASLKIGNNYKLYSDSYNWIDPVSNFHAQVTLSGGVSGALTIPFNFNYYDTNYSKIYVGEGGIAGFINNALNTTENGVIPSTNLPNAIIAPMWDNLTGGKIYVGTEGTSPNRKFIISWINMKHADDPDVLYSFQAILNETVSSIYINDIVFQYKTVSQDDPHLGAGLSGTIGIEDYEGLLGRQYSANGTTLLADNQALLFTMNNVVDTNPPVGKVSVFDYSATSVKFVIRFNEIVTGLDISDLNLSGTASGLQVVNLKGSGERYVATVTWTSALGSVGMSINAGAVVDLAGLPNEAVPAAYYIIPLYDDIFSDSMADGSNDWTVSEGQIGIYMLDGWEWGVPSGWYGPADGKSCWGTIIDGTYSNNMNAWLQSPVIHVTDSPVIQFDLWYNLEMDYDFGYVEVNAGVGWVNVTPGGYYTGSYKAWQRETIELDKDTFGNKDLQVRFRFVSNPSITEDGMYVRNFSVKSQFPEGVWAYSVNPSNLTVNSSANLSVTAYNMTTATYHNASAVISSADAGIGIGGDGKVTYGEMGPGAIVAALETVPVTAGAAGQFITNFVTLTHEVTTDEGVWYNNDKQLGISGASFDQTNIITAMTSLNVTNWLGQPIMGNGDENSGLVQLIYAGADGTNNPAGAGGAASGDDVVLYESSSLKTFGRFGAGGVAADAGKFSVDFLHNLVAGDKVYVRAWDGSDYVSSFAYGDSALYAVTTGGTQTIDFGAWMVGVPTGCKKDSNGDSVPDGWYVVFGGDPTNPVAPLPSTWTQETVAGGYGSESGEMAYPESVAAWNGYVYVADTRNDRIQVWNSDMSLVLYEIGVFGTGTNELNWPAGLAVNEDAGQLIVADMGNDRIVVYDINPTNGNLTSSFLFGGTGSGTLGFNKPRGVALDGANNIYIADQANNRIQVFSASGAYLRSISGMAAQPVSVAVDASDNIYAVLSSLNRVDVYDQIGANIGSFGTAGSGDGEMNQPADIKISKQGRIYIVDKSNHRIEIFDSSYNYLTAFGVQGVAEGELKYPQGMWLMPDGYNLYVADTWNHRVQKLSMILDVDGDGMDDIWEDANGLDSSNPDDAFADPDGDGLSNIGEYRVGTDPQNRDTNGNGIWDGAEVGMCEDPLGPFDGVVIDNVWVDGRHALSWNGDSGAVYDVEMATDLINTNWTVKDTVTATVDGAIGWTNSVVEPGRLHYYRIIRK